MLVGTLWSNRAACLVKLAESGNREESAMKAYYHQAYQDCSSALDGRVTKHLSESIRTKLLNRKEQAERALVGTTSS